MSCLIHIETSTKVCSVALSKDKKVLFYKENQEGSFHAELLGVFVYETFQYAKQNGLNLDAVSVSAGPGSYTGLRIGISEAKGFCYGLGIPLIAIPSLEIMAGQVVQSKEDADFYCPMIDARRMEVYAAVYDKRLNKLRDMAADIIDENSYIEFLSKGKVYFFGDGSAKCKAIISSPNARFLGNIYPMASGMVSIAEKKYEQKEFVNTAYFEPFYLKEFMATIAKNKII